MASCQMQCGQQMRAAGASRPARPETRNRCDASGLREARDVCEARESCGRVRSLVTAASATAPRRTSGRATGLVSLPLFDRFTTEPPIAADTEPRQASLSEQPVDRGRMNAKVFRQFLDGEDLIALSYLSHTLSGRTRRCPFFYSLRLFIA
jgi:hypothetical protein